MRVLLPLALLVALAGCEPEAPHVPRPDLADAADSLAYRIYEYAGGPEVWAQVPYLRFDFGSAYDTVDTRPPARRHLWNRLTGDYRLETTVDDTLYTALFNVRSRQGRVFQGTAELEGEAAASWLERAYRSFINDTYWLLVPVKLFDEGVTRSVEPDTMGHHVLGLAFEGVGLTPGDRYRLYADPETGALRAWGFVLEGNPDAPPSFIERTDEVTLDAPGGTARLATAHRVGSGRTLYTDAVALPASIPAGTFTDPTVRMD